MPRAEFHISGQTVKAGTTGRVELPIGRLMSGTPISLPLIVRHGRSEGPTIWLSAALHGDEIAGVEIIRRVLSTVSARSIKGTLLAAPVVNVHGFNSGSRYLPDRRDLNRLFPGSARGSLGARIAHLMMTQVVERCSLGIDLHTGSDHRTNFPQIRADLSDPTTLKMVEAFGAPVSLNSTPPAGSLRHAAVKLGIPVLLYEAGEANRFDEVGVRLGENGVLRVMQVLGMIDEAPTARNKTKLAGESYWLRASVSGILHLDAEVGERTIQGATIASIYDPFGTRMGVVNARTDGIVIGHTQKPLVNRGDAIAHIALLP